MSQISFENNPSQEKALDLMLTHRYTMLYGGSRSGKSFIIMFFIIFRALKKKSRHAVVRRHFSDIKRSVINETFMDVLSLMGVQVKLNKQDFVAYFSNGSEIHFIGVDDSAGLDKILGMELSSLWLNECSQLSYATYTILKTRLAQKSGLANRIFLDLNPPSKLHWVYRLFIEGIDPKDKTIVKHPEQYCFMKMNPADNEANIDKEYIQMLSELPKEERTRFYDGEFAEVEDGVLFSEANFNKFRDTKRPEMKKVIVAVDPAASENLKSDETGIIVCGKGMDDRGYLLEDVSGIYSPKEWGKKVKDMYVKWKATSIVAEKNQGGSMVKHVIQTADENLPVKLVHAKDGKRLRAQPISAIYEDGRISHVGSFPDTETEMALFTGKDGGKDNRVDAVVYGFTELFPVGVFSDSEIFNRDKLQYFKDYDFTESTNFGYIKIFSNIAKNKDYNFLALFMKIKDGKVFVTDCIYNTMLPGQNMDQVVSKFQSNRCSKMFLEANISYQSFFADLKAAKISARPVVEFNHEDNWIMSEADFICKTFAFEKNSDSVYYKNFMQQLNGYTVGSDDNNSYCAAVLPNISFVLKKLYKQYLKL